MKLETENDLLSWVFTKLQLARGKKHPLFATDVNHAFCYLAEEFGEVAREITKREEGWQQRMDSEIIDLIVVAVRILMRDYERR